MNTNTERKIDLHTHTHFSDGTYSPAELVRLADSEGLAAIAITDHDTIVGIDEAKLYGERYGVEIVPGCEIVADYMNTEIHILAYFIDYKCDCFTKKLNELKQIREDRNDKLLRRLLSLKINISRDELEAGAENGMVTRLHFAKAIVNGGYAKTISEAFEKYLNAGRPAYMGRTVAGSDECIDVIKKSGGVSVLAHPFSYKWKGGDVNHMIETLAKSGLDGVEAIYPTHDEGRTRQLYGVCGRLGLKISGGSDFHGENRPNIKLGRVGFGNANYIDYEVLVKLRGDSNGKITAF